MTIIGLAVPWTDDRLFGAAGEGANQSAFVITLDKANIPGINRMFLFGSLILSLKFADLINVTICISVLSIGLSCVYAGSRTLTALAETGYAPSIFTYVDKSSRPLPSVIAILIFAPIAYIQVRAKGVEVFDWLVALRYIF